MNPREFVLLKWKERACEKGLPEPHDLSTACKFAAAFAHMVYGGDIEANDFHTWVRKGEQIIDLTDQSADTEELISGRIPNSMKPYAKAWHLDALENVYENDEEFVSSPDFRESMDANQARVSAWYAEFTHNNR